MKKVTFVASASVYWICLDKIYSIFKSKGGAHFDVSIYFDTYLDDKPSQLQASMLLLKDKFSRDNILYHSDDDILAKSDYVFVSTVEAPFTRMISNVVTKIIYIPYGISITNYDIFEEYQYNSIIHNKAHLILTMNDYYKNMFKKRCAKGDDHVLSIGYPKFDSIFDFKDEYKKTSRNKKVFMWSVHYNLSSAFSNWLTNGQNLLDHLCTRDDIIILFRPHPFFFWSITQTYGIDESNRIKDLISKHFILDESDSYLNSFCESDALISDGSSILIDYATMGKPICFIRNGDTSLYLNDFALLLTNECTHQASTVEDVQIFIDKVISNDVELMKNSNQFINEKQMLGPIDGTVSLKIFEHIKNTM
jgi:hypothetical protein